MKKFTKIMSALILTLVCLVSVVSFAGCNKNKTVARIKLNKNIVTDYSLNDEIDLNDAKLTVIYEDESQKSVEITNNMISGFDTTTVGTRKLKIKYAEKEISVKYNVYEKDCATVINKVSQNLLNANTFIAMESRYDEAASE